MWVANGLNHTVAIFNASDGSGVQILKDEAFCFNRPTNFAFYGTHMWVLNQGTWPPGSVSVTKVATTNP